MSELNITTGQLYTISSTKNQSLYPRRDLVCFSHLRWNFVYQRPHHLFVRGVKERRVFYVEEPKIDRGPNRVIVNQDASGVNIVVPYLHETVFRFESAHILRGLMNQFLEENEIRDYIAWYYNPRAFNYTNHLKHTFTVYDVMDDLASFNGAPKDMLDFETMLFQEADIVFTGGHSLYDAKRHLHKDIHPFPSSIDIQHFSRARSGPKEPQDQARIPRPRIGFFGVIDERIDYSLIERIARVRPDWQIIMIGPFAKVEEKDLPKAENVHYLGKKSYEDLPNYLGGWDVAILPFARNRATRYISPTKTPEYLAGGIPVVSTPIKDVVRPYGDYGVATIAEGDEFITSIEDTINRTPNEHQEWLERVEKILKGSSWDETWKKMSDLINTRLEQKNDETFSTLPINDDSADSTTIAVPPLFNETTERSETLVKGVYDYLIVGAGFAGSILAERLARGSGKKVLIIDRRPHIAGNAYDHYDQDGLLVHKYGPHIFHTNSDEVFTYLSHFTHWRPYEHRVRTSVDGLLLPMPINLDTINTLYGMKLNSFELQAFFESVAEKVDQVRTSEDVVIGKVGKEIYEKFFRNYTRKQWGLDPSELDASVTSRVPIRFNRDDRYFLDKYQSMPLNGYTKMFENILDHPNIHVMLNTEYQEVIGYVPFQEVIFTGPVDEYFEFVYGKLPYRSLQFRFETLEKEQHQEVAVINYPNEFPYTRVTEFKHLTGQKHHKTSLVYEYPCSEGDPYYPIPRPENAELYKKYKELAERANSVYFAGRLGTYKYYNMDQVAAQALNLYARIAGVSKLEASRTYTNSSFSIEIPCSLIFNQNSE